MSDAGNSASTGRIVGKPFTPGVSGNPSGRPKIVSEIAALARAQTSTALNALVEIATKGEKEAARVSAAVALLDRGWGKPLQPTQEQDEDGRAIGRALVVFRVET